MRIGRRMKIEMGRSREREKKSGVGIVVWCAWSCSGEWVGFESAGVEFGNRLVDGAETVGCGVDVGVGGEDGGLGLDVGLGFGLAVGVRAHYDRCGVVRSCCELVSTCYC
jgi:hypothetical protein